MSKVWFTSDTHFGHVNIIHLCNRPYSDIKEMDESLIKNWNYRIKENDIVYHLGDFAMGKKENIPNTLNRLNGYKILIKGNHDRSAKFMLESGFSEVHNKIELSTIHRDIDKELKLFLSHHPIEISDSKYDFYLCGHIHGFWKIKGNQINVGVDVWNYTPRTIEELTEGLLATGSTT